MLIYSGDVDGVSDGSYTFTQIELIYLSESHSHHTKFGII